MRIEDYTLTRFEFWRDRVIGDAQVRVPMHNLGALELHTDSGYTGTGFFGALFSPLPALAELERVFDVEVAGSVIGQDPFALANRVSRPRGGNRRPLPFGQAVDQAIWDLQGKALDLPLYRLLGGTENRVRAYASGLGFHLTREQFSDFFRQAAGMGFSAFKIKVGHPDLAWDLERLRLLHEAVGGGATVMIDANETWSPKEAIRRAHAYRDAGFDILWIEDPCMRDDFAGLAEVRRAVPFAHINTGEYLDLRGKRQLIEAGGADMLNIHGHFSDGLRIGWLAAEYGIPVTLGNTPFEVGVHLACALPECDWLEYSFQNYNHLLEEPVQFKDGYAYAPDRPGHGLALSAAARAGYARPEVANPETLAQESAPPGPISLK